MAVYWLAKEEMANKKFPSLLKLLKMLGLEKMKHFQHRSAGSTIEIFLTLGKVLKQRVVEALKTSKAFGLLVDEVTDIAVKEQLMAFVQYVGDEGHPLVNSFSLKMFWNSPRLPMPKQLQNVSRTI